MRAEEDAGPHRSSCSPASSVAATAFLAQLAAIGAGRGRALARALRLLPRRRASRGRLGLSRARDHLGRAGVRRCRGARRASSPRRKRTAIGLATGVLVIAFALRTVADRVRRARLAALGDAARLGRGAAALRRPAAARPAPARAVTATLLLAAAAALAARRDIGSGLLPARDSAEPRLRLLRSPAAQALRSERGALVAWLVGVGGFALLMGVISDAATPDVVSENVQRQLEKLGTESVVTPSGWLGFSFIFFILAVSLFCCMQVASIREEEAEQRLETLLALPVGRSGWLAGRLLLAAAGAAALALAAGLLAWAGAAAQGADVSLPEMLGAGANVLPPALLFLALGALAFALAPAHEHGDRLRPRRPRLHLGAVRRPLGGTRLAARRLALPRRRPRARRALRGRLRPRSCSRSPPPSRSPQSRSSGGVTWLRRSATLIHRCRRLVCRRAPKVVHRPCSRRPPRTRVADE